MVRGISTSRGMAACAGGTAAARRLCRAVASETGRAARPAPARPYGFAEAAMDREGSSIPSVEPASSFPPAGPCPRHPRSPLRDPQEKK